MFSFGSDLKVYKITNLLENYLTRILPLLHD